MDLVEQYKSLKSKKESLDIELAGLESSFSTLKSQLDSLLSDLYSTYKVKSLSEAENLLSKEETELSELLSQAESVLNSIDYIS